jgi:hypothetical protein
MILKETGRDVDWVHMAWDGFQQQVPVNMAVNLQIPHRLENFLTS